MQEKEESCLHHHTRRMFIGSKLLISPLEAMFGLLILIFYKDLHATPLQMTLLVSIKPLVALLSFYGHLVIKEQPLRLKLFIASSTFLGILPCFFFPFIDNSWFFLASYALFVMAGRAAIPAWSEILKINLSSEARGKIFSQGASANYLVNLLIPLSISPLMDHYPGSWKWIFFSLALVQILNLLLLLSIQIRSFQHKKHAPKPTMTRSAIISPWRDAWSLIKERADFRHFQCAFMLGGAGLMVTHPVLPVFFQETLRITYTELTLATSLCKGVSFALFAPIWGRSIHRIPIQIFNSLFMLGAAIYGLLIIASAHEIVWLYIAYFMYGAVQAGSELSWNLSGPIFSGEKDSTLFTGVNVAMVGLRGCLFPFLGEILYLFSGTSTVFFTSSLLCLAGACYSLWSVRFIPQEKLLRQQTTF